MSFSPCPVGGKALTDTQQWGDLQDVQDEESSGEEEEEDFEGVPSPSNNFNFLPDIVARFEEGYQGNPAAGMEAMQKTYVSQSLASSPRPAACSVTHLASGIHTLYVLVLPMCCCLLSPSANTVSMESLGLPAALAREHAQHGSVAVQEWRRSIEGFNMLQQPQPHFGTFKVSAAAPWLPCSCASVTSATPQSTPMTSDAHAVQGLFDHGVMALTKKKHPVWVIKVSLAYSTLLTQAGLLVPGLQQRRRLTDNWQAMTTSAFGVI